MFLPSRRFSKISIFTVLFVLLLAVSGLAVYYHSLLSEGSASEPIYEHSVSILHNSPAMVDGLGLDQVNKTSVNEAFGLAGYFTALKPGYLVVTGRTNGSQLYVGVQINLNGTKPSQYFLNGTTEVPIFTITPNSMNSTFFQSEFLNGFVLLPILPGNVSIYLGTTIPAIEYTLLNATYHY
jgi:hypothetical protein